MNKLISFPLDKSLIRKVLTKQDLLNYISQDSFHQLSLDNPKLLQNIQWLSTVLILEHHIFDVQWIVDNFFYDKTSGWFLPRLNLSQIIDPNCFTIEHTFDKGNQEQGVELLLKMINKQLSVSSRPFIVGLSAGAGTGKTTIAKGLQVDAKIELEGFYRPREERDKLALYGKDAINIELLFQQIQNLKTGKPADIPLYNRISGMVDSSTSIKNAQTIILDGIWPFAFEEIVPLIDLKVSIFIEDEIRLERQYDRDIPMRLPKGVTLATATVKDIELAKLEIAKRFFQKTFRDQRGYIAPQLPMSDIILDISRGKLMIKVG